MAFYVQRQFVIGFSVTKNVNRVFNQAIWHAMHGTGLTKNRKTFLRTMWMFCTWKGLIGLIAADMVDNSIPLKDLRCD